MIRVYVDYCRNKTDYKLFFSPYIQMQIHMFGTFILLDLNFNYFIIWWQSIHICVRLCDFSQFDNWSRSSFSLELFSLALRDYFLEKLRNSLKKLTFSSNHSAIKTHRTDVFQFYGMCTRNINVHWKSLAIIYLSWDIGLENVTDDTMLRNTLQNIKHRKKRFQVPDL